MKAKTIFSLIVVVLTVLAGFVALGNPMPTDTILALTILPAVLTDANGNEIPPLTRAQKRLFDYARMKANEVTLQAFLTRALKWDNITYYIAKVITGLSGRQILLNASTSYLIGACNLDKGQLPQYYNFCYDRVEVEEAINNTSSSLVVANLVSYSSVLSSMDAGLGNGHLITMLNREVQMETPVSDFASKVAVSGGGAKDFDGGELAEPLIWIEQQQVEVDLDLAAAIASAANTTYAAKVLFKGCQIRLK